MCKIGTIALALIFAFSSQGYLLGAMSEFAKAFILEEAQTLAEAPRRTPESALILDLPQILGVRILVPVVFALTLLCPVNLIL
tara:strand:- start:304 stop:552 length:249 start_codon:yes stop_codon:yes gene_type:complete